MDLYLVAVVLLHWHYPAVVVDHVAEVVESYSAAAMYGAVLNSLPRFQPAADLGGEFVRRDLNPLQMKSMTLEARLEGLTFWEQGMMAKEC